MKNRTFLIVVGFSAAVMLVLSFSAAAATKKTSSPGTSASPAASASTSPAKNPRPNPFHGMATKVDQSAKTFTIAGKEKSRVFKVTDATKITKAGNPATMADVVENNEISGAYWIRPDGTLEAKTVKIGPAKKKEKTTDSTSPAASPKP